MHVNWELKSKNAENSLEQHTIVEDLLAVANIIIEETVQYRKQVRKL